jgi:hypothetical protein
VLPGRLKRLIILASFRQYTTNDCIANYCNHLGSSQWRRRRGGLPAISPRSVSYLRGPYGVEVINLTGVSIDRSRGLGRKRSPMTFAFIGTSARESQCLSSKALDRIS